MSPSRFASEAVGGWVELGRNTGTLRDISSLADKRYLMILNNAKGWSSGNNSSFRLNSDTGTNYAARWQRNGASDATEANKTQIYDYIGTGTENEIFAVNYLANLSAKEKLHIGHSVVQKTAGAGTAPSRDEIVNKWANTASVINRITAVNSAGAGSEYVVLGWDPADTHTTNFWEELASVDQTTPAATFPSGTFTAKKYLWIQYWQENSSVANGGIQFNGDTGTNYAFRYSNDGGADGTSASVNQIQNKINTANTPFFVNMFVINNSANEKLTYGSIVGQNTAGAGTAPKRDEVVGKWANTSAQITSLNLIASSGNMAGYLRVWGSN